MRSFAQIDMLSEGTTGSKDTTSPVRAMVRMPPRFGVSSARAGIAKTGARQGRGREAERGTLQQAPTLRAPAIRARQARMTGHGVILMM